VSALLVVRPSVDVVVAAETASRLSLQSLLSGMEQIGQALLGARMTSGE